VASDADRLRPKNLMWLVAVLGSSLTLSVVSMGFELLVEEIAALMRGFGHQGQALVGLLLVGVLLAAFGVNLPALWNGRPRGFRYAGVILVASIVANVAILCGGTFSRHGEAAGIGLVVSIVLNLFAARLMTSPDIGAYVSYRADGSPGN
jgi:hypothetical protein